MTPHERAKSWIAETLKAEGFRGRGTIWRLTSPELQWVVHIDELPYGNRLGIDIGLDLQSANERRRPTDCAVLLHLENLPAVNHYSVVRSLDLDSGQSPEQRRQEIESAVQILARYLAGHLTMDDVRAAYRAGDFTGFIHRDARAALESH